MVDSSGSGGPWCRRSSLKKQQHREMSPRAAKKRKRVVVTMQQKLEAIQRLDMGQNLKSISLELGVGDSTVQDWKRNRKQIEAYCGRMACKESLRGRKVASRIKNTSLDEAVLLWIKQEREKGTSITGPLIQQKALALHKLMGGEQRGFVASPGWLDRFKKRNGIARLGGGTPPHLNGLLLVDNLSREQVYTADELGLSYRRPPLPAGECQWCRDRMTIMVCSNAAGTHKLPLVVVGRVLQNVNITSLPIVYKKTSWMTADVLHEWFLHNFVPAVRQHLKDRNLPDRAVLVLDNAAAHHGAERLVCGDVRAVYFPHSLALRTQPMHQGILRSVALRYRRRLLATLHASHLGLLDLLRNISIRDVVHMCVAAWDETPTSALVGAWRHCWVVGSDDKDEPEDELDAAHFVDMLRQLPDCHDVGQQAVQEWLDMDHDVSRRRLLSDSEIVSAVRGDHQVISHEDGARFLELALLYIEQQVTSTSDDVALLRRLKEQAVFRRNNNSSGDKSVSLCEMLRVRRSSGPK